jgi:hypothetical protein
MSACGCAGAWAVVDAALRAHLRGRLEPAILTKVRPYRAALYSSMLSNADHPASCTDLARLVRARPSTARSSNATAVRPGTCEQQLPVTRGHLDSERAPSSVILSTGRLASWGRRGHSAPGPTDLGSREGRPRRRPPPRMRASGGPDCAAGGRSGALLSTDRHGEAAGPGRGAPLGLGRASHATRVHHDVGGFQALWLVMRLRFTGSRPDQP